MACCGEVPVSVIAGALDCVAQLGVGLASGAGLGARALESVFVFVVLALDELVLRWDALDSCVSENDGVEEPVCVGVQICVLDVDSDRACDFVSYPEDDCDDDARVTRPLTRMAFGDSDVTELFG